MTQGVCQGSRAVRPDREQHRRLLHEASSLGHVPRVPQDHHERAGRVRLGLSARGLRASRAANRVSARACTSRFRASMKPSGPSLAHYPLAVASDPRPTFAQGGASEADSVRRVSGSASPRRRRVTCETACVVHVSRACDVVLLLCLRFLDAAAHTIGLNDPLLTPRAWGVCNMCYCAKSREQYYSPLSQGGSGER